MAKKKPQPIVHYGGRFSPTAVVSREQLEEAVEWHSRWDEFVFDLETVGTRTARAKKDKPGLDPVTNRVIWISLASPGRADAIPIGHPTGPQQLMAADVFDALKPLFFSDRRKINHNVGFDLLSIAKYYGEIPPPPYGETQVLTHLLNENLVFGQGGYNLGSLVERYLEFEYRKLSKEGESMDSYPFEDVALYSYLDAKMTWMLWCYLQPRLKRYPELVEIFNMEMTLLDVLVRMRHRGVQVDRAGFDRFNTELQDRLQVLEQKIHEAAGHPFLITSTQQKAKVLYEELGLKVHAETAKVGNPSTSEEALKPLKKKHPIVPLLMEHAKVKKLHSTYVQGYIPQVEDDGRIRSSLKQHGTTTGRFSSSDPNLQNIPRAGDEYGAKIRSLFVSPPGYVLVVGDYNMIELRLIAHFTEDRKMLRSFREGLDLHALTAAGIFGIPVEDVTKEKRYMGKTSNFNFSYGGGPKRVMEVTDCSLAEAKRAYEGYHNTYPGVKRWSNRTIRECKEMNRPHVTTLLGRKRRLPDINSPDAAKRSYAERQAVNTVIQGSAADIMKMAMVRADRRIERAGHRGDWFLVLTVHDELIMEVPEADAEDGVALMREAMEGVKVDLQVPLPADIHWGKRWDEAK